MLTERSINAISKQALAEYPSECCGIVTGTTAVQHVHGCVNHADELHAKDPEQNPRTSHEAYVMDREEAERIMTAAAAQGEKILAFYHSHIDCGAYFSQMDKDVLTVFGEPEFPDAVNIVVSVQTGRIAEIKGFLWDGEKQDFVPIDVV